MHTGIVGVHYDPSALHPTIESRRETLDVFGQIVFRQVK